MKRIFIVSNPTKDLEYGVTKDVISLLLSCGAEIFMLSDSKNPDIQSVEFAKEPPADIDCIIAIGGDGTFIRAAHYAVEISAPVIGINLGKLGYLSEVEPSNVSVLKKIFDDDFKIDKKILLEAIYKENGAVIEKRDSAVNDVVISHKDYLGISDFVLLSNDGRVKYRADGIVFATPQGSTAYSLSAGGPVVSHEADAVIVTPISPHSFFNRSIVFGKNEQISIKNTSDDVMHITVDGALMTKMNPGAECTVKVSHKFLKVLTFKENNMFENLFSKMQILEDII